VFTFQASIWAGGSGDYVLNECDGRDSNGGSFNASVVVQGGVGLGLANVVNAGVMGSITGSASGSVHFNHATDKWMGIGTFQLSGEINAYARIYFYTYQYLLKRVSTGGGFEFGG